MFESGGWLPAVYKPRFLARAIQRLRLWIVRRKLQALGCSRFVLYVTRPSLLPDVDLAWANLVCYHVFDDYSFSDSEVPISPEEGRVLKASHLPIFSSRAMLADKGGLNDHSIHIPNGVDFEHFSRSYPCPRELAGIRRPIIGYSGVVKKQLNLPLIVDLATRRPDWSFVFVGPILNVAGMESALDDLRRLRNVHFLGRKDPACLPSYVSHFDVGLMCYVKNNYTRYIAPLKLNEYMAAGTLIVGTPIEPLLPYSSCIYLAESADEWESAIESALSDSDDAVERRAEGVALARRSDWNILTHQLERAMFDRLNRGVSSGGA